MRLERAIVRRTTVGLAIALCATVAVGGLSGCASRNRDQSGPKVYSAQQQRHGFLGLGRRAAPADSEAQGTLGVNSFLWRAALDTMSFMPLQSADPYGGLIITDWYSAPEKADERFKATVYILDTRLRADGLNVALQKQVRAPDGSWRDAAVAPQTETDLENAILTKARQLRVNGRG
jgi:hypothetical protein